MITDDPLRLEVGGTKFEIDLGAESLLAAERQGQKIRVEIKSFLGESPLTDYHVALGQFLNYRLALEISQPARTFWRFPSGHTNPSSSENSLNYL